MAVAVVGAGEQLTYGEVHRRSNRLAHRLAALGVGPETPVGICMDRRPALIVALLGVLKAGGAYLPLDPSLPRERLAFMVEDSGVRLLLSEQRHADALPEHRPRVLCLESEPIAADGTEEQDPTPGVRPDSAGRRCAGRFARCSSRSGRSTEAHAFIASCWLEGSSAA